MCIDLDVVASGIIEGIYYVIHYIYKLKNIYTWYEVRYRIQKEHAKSAQMQLRSLEFR